MCSERNEDVKKRIGCVLLLLILAVLSACQTATEDVAQKRKKSAVAVISLHAFWELEQAARELESYMDVDIYSHGKPPFPSFEGIDLTRYDLIFAEGIGAKLGFHIDQFDAAKTATKVVVVKPRYIQGNVSLDHHPWLEQYWTNSSRENVRRLMHYLGANLLALPIETQPPIAYPEHAFYHPDAPELFVSHRAYRDWREQARQKRHRPSKNPLNIGIVFYQDNYIKGNTAYVDSLVRNVELRGHRVFPLMGKGGFLFDPYLIEDGKSLVDALIFCGTKINWFDYGKGQQHAHALNVPILSGINFYPGTPDQWRDNIGGLSPDMTPQAVYSETDGIIEPIVISGRVADETGQPKNQIMPDQLDWRVERALAWAQLRRMSNREKRLVIPYYSEGAGKANIGSDPDFYLNVQASLVNILKALKEAGYNVGEKPLPDVETLSRMMAEQGSNVGNWAPGEMGKRVGQGHAITIPENTYLNWFGELPEKKQREMIDNWGAPPGSIMVHTARDGQRMISIPKIQFGNVLLVPHPDWGYKQDEDVLYSKDQLPPHHQYFAFFEWLQQVYNPHAMLTMFTQLSLMPGKMEGPARTDWVGRLIGNMPHIYPTPLQGNAGIGSKRRASALTIGFMPTIVASELYENLHELRNKTARLGENLPPAVRAELETGIRQECERLHLARDLGLDIQGAPFDQLATATRTYLEEINREHIPYGPHTLGVPPEGRPLVDMVRSMLGREFREALVAHRADVSPDTLAKIILTDLLLSGETTQDIQRTQLKAASEDIEIYLQRALDYKARIEAAREEVPRILSALEGRFIEPGEMDDAIRNPDALPSGRNPYHFDHRSMPTREAWEVGRRLADDMLNQHVEKHGAYPRRVGYVLWSSEITKNKGILEAQVFYLLGVRPVWNKRGWVADIEVIPPHELKRPRVDVFVTTSGTYRDHFMDKIRLIHKAVKLVSELDEPDNIVRIHTEAAYQKLASAGPSPESAQSLASIRVFSENVGAYSPSIQFAIHAGGTWEDDGKISDLYMTRMSHAYGENTVGEYVQDLFRQNIETVEIASFGRTSNVYGVLDHPMVAAYLGGMNMAVRNTTDRKIDLYIHNLRNPQSERVETLERFYSRELRSRYFNPKWIRGMMDHGYDGARYMTEFTETMWVWEVTSPDLVSDEDWKRIHQVYMKDEYDLGLEDYFSENNPYAEQTMMATLLEAAHKGYWQATDEVLQDVAQQLAQSVSDHGPACNSGICNSPSLETFVTELLNKTPGVQALAQPYQDAINIARQARYDLPPAPAEPMTGYEMADVVRTVADHLSTHKTTYFAIGIISALLVAFGWLRQRRKTW